MDANRDGLWMGVLALVMLAVPAVCAPGYGEPLTITTGTVTVVSSVAELTGAVDAANAAGVPATILVADGTYVLDVPALAIDCDGLIVRSASGVSVDNNTVYIPAYWAPIEYRFAGSSNGLSATPATNTYTHMEAYARDAALYRVRVEMEPLPFP